MVRGRVDREVLQPPQQEPRRNRLCPDQEPRLLQKRLASFSTSKEEPQLEVHPKLTSGEWSKSRQIRVLPPHF